MLESHGAYVFGVLMAARPLPDEDRIAYEEVDLVATPDRTGDSAKDLTRR